ncbi:hypothetical protein [Fibrella arboris]|uniref:hypothetical protein n=1 Tax=Fibrella arboris TaxID=3242486 RepID=UPI003522433B
MPDDSGEALSVEEAEKWFQSTYLKGPAGARLAGDTGGHKRIAQWEKAVKHKQSGKREFVWAPIAYEDEKRPVLLDWDEKTEYKVELAKYFAKPLVEGVVVVKEKGVTNAFLVQIAYDPVALQMKGSVTRENFSGWLVRADWNDRFIDGIKFEEGKSGEYYVDSKIDVKGGRRVYQMITVKYQTVTGSSCGPNCTEVTVTEHTDTQWIWIPDGGVSGGGGGGGPVNTGPYYDPSFGGGGVNGGTSAPTSFHMTTALSNRFSNDRRVFSQAIKDAVNATGLAASMAGFTVDKAQAIAGAIGAELRGLSPVVSIMGKSCAVLSLATSAGALYMGVADDGFTWDDDGWNAVQTGLGVIGVGLIIAGAAPVFAVAVGAVSIGIAVGTTIQAME